MSHQEIEFSLKLAFSKLLQRKQAGSRAFAFIDDDNAIIVGRAQGGYYARFVKGSKYLPSFFFSSQADFEKRAEQVALKMLAQDRLYK